MGYYSGDGVVTGGSNEISILMSGGFNGTWNTIYQKRVSSTTVKNGVSEQTATSAAGTCNIQPHQVETGSYYIPACKGSKSTTSYSRIGDSNLFMLSILIDTLSVKLNNGSWISS